MALLAIVIVLVCMFGLTAWADKALPPAERLPIGWHWDGEPAQISARRVSLYCLPVMALFCLVVVSVFLSVLFGHSFWHTVVVPAVFFLLGQMFILLRLRRWFRRGMPQGWFNAPGGLNRPHG
jgi:hypothetical protein